MARHLAQIGAVAHPLFVDPNFPKSDRSDEFCTSPTVGVKNRHRFPSRVAQFFCGKKRGEMIPGGNCKFARANKDSGTMLHRPIPVLVVNRIGRRNEFDSIISEGMKQFGHFRRARDATVGFAYDFHEATESRRIAQLLCDLVCPGFF